MLVNGFLVDRASEALSEMREFAIPADAAIAQYFKKRPNIGKRDRAAARELVFAALRGKEAADVFLSQNNLLGPDPKRNARLRILAALTALEGADPKSFLDFVGEDEYAQLCRCADARREWMRGLPCESLLPQWFVDELREGNGAGDDEIKRLGRALARPALPCVRCNLLKGPRDKIFERLAQAYPGAEKTRRSPWGARFGARADVMGGPLGQSGEIEMQDEGSQLLALLADARPGKIVVDFCAGAGGKTLALGAAMRNKGRLYAMDVNGLRLAKLGPRLKRAGLTTVTPMRLDSENDPRLARLRGKADLVFVDAPCSGSGTLKRSPDLKYRQSREALGALLPQQASILRSASKLTAPGGRLVYATCSVFARENERQAEAFLAQAPEFRLESLAPFCRQVGLPDDSPYFRADSAEEMDGFFAAAFRKATR